MMRVAVIIAAAGEGSRFGGFKQQALIGGKPVVDWCLETFESHPSISEIVLVINEKAQPLDSWRRFSKLQEVVAGGKRRLDSVASGFQHVRSGPKSLVLVHDGARPLVSRELISRVIETAGASGAAVPVWPVEDTLKKVAGEYVMKTVDREGLFRAQTPQGFAYRLLQEALETALTKKLKATDEAFLIEQLGYEVRAVKGERQNIKITVPEDIKIAEAFLEH